MIINATACKKNDCLPLVRAMGHFAGPCHEIVDGSAASLKTGDILSQGSTGLFAAAGMVWLSDWRETRSCHPAELAPLLVALADIPGGNHCLDIRRKGWTLAGITLSDKGALGQREDRSGPAIYDTISQSLDISLYRQFLIADDAGLLRALLAQLALRDQFDIICTSGGTGLGPRDITPQATKTLIDVELPGFRQTMLLSSLQKTPNAAISRAEAGLIGKTLVINLPGSLKAVRENLQALLPCLEHALAKIHGDASDCGG